MLGVKSKFFILEKIWLPGMINITHNGLMFTCAELMLVPVVRVLGQFYSCMRVSV